jgi:hypothetical protein
VPSQLHVPGDAAATVDNLMTRTGLFHLGLLGDVVMMSAEVMVTAMLFFMFKSVNATLSFAAALARAMMVAVMASMLFFQAGAIHFADPNSAMNLMFEPLRMEWVMMMLYLHDAGVWIWQIFFTLHLMLLGFLVIRSDAYPRVLGPALMIGGLGYVLDSIYAFALPDLDLLGSIRAMLLVIVTLAELSFALLLLIKGRTPSTR